MIFLIYKLIKSADTSINMFEIFDKIFVVVLIILFVIYLYSTSSKKETKRERFAEGAKNMMADAAHATGKAVQELAESPKSKSIRLAKEELNRRNAHIFYTHTFSKSHIRFLLDVDEKFEKQLNELGLSGTKWQDDIATKLLYIRIISYWSRNGIDSSKRNTSDDRRMYINDKSRGKDEISSHKLITTALSYYEIPEEDWINYGDAVIEMYELTEDEDLVLYGYLDLS